MIAEEEEQSSKWADGLRALLHNVAMDNISYRVGAERERERERESGKEDSRQDT